MIHFYQKNLIYTFIKSLMKIILIFFSLIIILNIFEEISYFKNENVDIFLPIFLTILNAPSVLFDILPFVFLISALYFFSEILDKDELNIYKNFGITNFKILSLISLVSFFLGIFFILIFYNLSSNLKKTPHLKSIFELIPVTLDAMGYSSDVSRIDSSINLKNTGFFYGHIFPKNYLHQHGIKLITGE